MPQKTSPVKEENNDRAFSAPKGTVRAILILAITIAVAYTWVVAGQAPDLMFKLAMGAWALYFGQKALKKLLERKKPFLAEEGNRPLGLPKGTVRGLVCLIVTMTSFYIMIKTGTANEQMGQALALVWGFYFAQHGLEALYRK